MNFELRWLQVPHTTTKPPRLQIRHKQEFGPANALGRACKYSEWVDVPLVILEEVK